MKAVFKLNSHSKQLLSSMTLHLEINQCDWRLSRMWPMKKHTTPTSLREREIGGIESMQIGIEVEMRTKERDLSE